MTRTKVLPSDRPPLVVYPTRGNTLVTPTVDRRPARRLFEIAHQTDSHRPGERAVALKVQWLGRRWNPFRDRGCHHHAIFQECINMLFHFSRKPRHRPQQLLAVRPEQYFSEHWKRHPAAGLSIPERTVVVKAYTDGDGDSFRAVSGPHEERVPELVGGPRFSHHRDRERMGVQRMSRAGGHAHHAPQTLLNERKRHTVDMGRRRRVSAIGDYLARVPYDLADHIRLGQYAGCDRAICIRQLQQVHFGGAQGRRGVWAQGRLYRSEEHTSE